MSTTNEIEILLKKAVILLHSSHANSATELRLLLDEEIKKRYGTENTITNGLSKKQLEDESSFPGRAATPPPQPVEAEEVINLIHSPAKTISDSPDTIADSDDAVSGAGAGGVLLSTTAEDETNLKEFVDLNCCVCGEIRFTATNRLIECSKCGDLYHQECHKPTITNEEASEEQGHIWQCDSCSSKSTTTVTTKQTSNSTSGIVVLPDEPMPLITTSSVASMKSKSSATSSRSSSSSNSSSPYHKMEQIQVTNTAVTGKSSTSKTHREERTSTSSSKVTTMNSSIISTSSKKHSSSSGKSKSSKHHDGRRKSNK